MYELSHKLPNNPRLRIVENKEILAKFQECIETQPSVHSLCKSKFLALMVKKCLKTDIKDFWYCLTLLDLLIFPKIFCRRL